MLSTRDVSFAADQGNNLLKQFNGVIVQTLVVPAYMHVHMCVGACVYLYVLQAFEVITG